MRGSRFRLFVGAASAVLFGLAASVGTSQAAPITYEFSGTIDNVTAGLSPPFSVTDTFTGSYTIESTTTARAGSNSDFAFYDAVLSFNVSVVDAGATQVYSASLDSATGRREVQIDDAPNAPNDRYGISTFASDGLVGADVNGLALFGASFRLDDSTNAVFNDALVLPTDIAFSDFDSSGFFLFFGPDLVTVSGTLNALRRVPVPEPETLPLLMVGLFGLMGAGLYRQRRRSA